MLVANEVHIIYFECTFRVFPLLISSNWWPFFVVVFYVLAPIPSIIARRVSEDTGGSNPCKELAYFVTAVIVVSAFGLPIVLARSPSSAPVVSVKLAGTHSLALKDCQCGNHES